MPCGRHGESSPQRQHDRTARRSSDRVDATTHDRSTVRGWPRFPPPYARARCSRSPASSSTTRGATTSSSPGLLGVEPDGRPWAELWLGTHPNGPATLADGRPLADVTGPLPYLLKVLAAAEPLSLQAHPAREQAARRVRRRPLPGPRAEARAALRADPVRGASAVSARSTPRSTCSTSSAPTSWPPSCAAHGPGEALDGAVPGPHPGRADRRRRGRAAHAPRRRGCAAWRSATPATPASPPRCCSTTCGSPPGEAIHLGPGNLHAYLGGAGIELMGASDNVVRGGLTVKPVDVDDLLAVARPDAARRPGAATRRRATRCRTRRSACVRLAGPACREATGRRARRDLDGPHRLPLPWRRPRRPRRHHRLRRHRLTHPSARTTGVRAPDTRTASNTRIRLRHGLADLDDLLGGVVGVGALDLEQGAAVAGRLALGARRCRRGRSPPRRRAR